VGERGENGQAGDPVRLLAARSEHGYTDNRFMALPDEPEAVSPAEQRRLTQLAHRRDHERRVAIFTITSGAINKALDTFVASVGTDPRLADRVRSVRRTTQALGREVGAS
jgi:hypothetical protein